MPTKVGQLCSSSDIPLTIPKSLLLGINLIPELLQKCIKCRQFKQKLEESDCADNIVIRLISLSTFMLVVFYLHSIVLTIFRLT